MPSKDPRLMAVVDRLRSDLGPSAFVVEDHWDADLLAIGLAAPHDRQQLVYVAVDQDTGTVAYECESASLSPEAVYDSQGMVEDVTYDDLRRAVETHLRP